MNGSISIRRTSVRKSRWVSPESRRKLSTHALHKKLFNVFDREEWLSVLDQVKGHCRRASSVSAERSRRVSLNCFLPSRKQLTVQDPYTLSRRTPEPTFRLLPKPRREPVNPDWKDSVLDRQVLQNYLHFNWQKHEDVYTSSQVEKFLKPATRVPRPPDALEKGQQTVERLRTELLLQHSAVPRYRLTILSLYKTCRQLLDAHKLTVEILFLLRKRQQLVDLVLKMEPYEVECMSHTYHQVQLHSNKILALVENWKDLQTPYNKFIYDGIECCQRFEAESQQLLERIGHCLNAD